MVVELLSVALTGADAARDDKGRRNGAVFLAIDPSAVRPLDEFRRAAAEINARVTGVPPAPGFDSVLIPGEVEARSREVRRTEGIPVAESTWEAIQAAGQSVGAHISV